MSYKLNSEKLDLALDGSVSRADMGVSEQDRIMELVNKHPRLARLAVRALGIVLLGAVAATPFTEEKSSPSPKPNTKITQQDNKTKNEAAETILIRK